MKAIYSLFRKSETKQWMSNEYKEKTKFVYDEMTFEQGMNVLLSVVYNKIGKGFTIVKRNDDCHDETGIGGQKVEEFVLTKNDYLPGGYHRERRVTYTLYRRLEGVA